MSTQAIELPLSSTETVASQQEVSALLREAARSETAVYPIGGGCSLDYGLPARRPGIGLRLGHLDAIVDYPAEDMTITVGPGITMAELERICGEQGQQVPLDVPDSQEATLGGVLATDWSGPRRYGYGRVRDYVIGVRGVDGLGRRLAGGGRVVKNVAGYDFCKLMVGSLGTLGVITEITLKLRPRPASRCLVIANDLDPDNIEALLSQLVHTSTYPAAIEWIGGPWWAKRAGELPGGPSPPAAETVLVLFEGTPQETAWSGRKLCDEWHTAGLARGVFVDASEERWGTGLTHLTAFSAQPQAPLAVKCNVRPSGVVAVVQMLRQIDKDVSFQAHAGSGIVKAVFSTWPKGGLSRAMTQLLQPACAKHDGNAVILSNPSGNEVTRQSVWGVLAISTQLHARIKEQFDPRDILNPGRFVY